LAALECSVPFDNSEANASDTENSELEFQLSTPLSDAGFSRAAPLATSLRTDSD
jgi:hypothetical protein